MRVINTERAPNVKLLVRSLKDGDGACVVRMFLASPVSE